MTTAHSPSNGMFLKGSTNQQHCSEQLHLPQLQEAYWPPRSLTGSATISGSDVCQMNVSRLSQESEISKWNWVKTYGLLGFEAFCRVGWHRFSDFRGLLDDLFGRHFFSDWSVKRSVESACQWRIDIALLTDNFWVAEESPEIEMAISWTKEIERGHGYLYLIISLISSIEAEAVHC